MIWTKSPLLPCSKKEILKSNESYKLFSKLRRLSELYVLYISLMTLTDFFFFFAHPAFDILSKYFAVWPAMRFWRWFYNNPTIFNAIIAIRFMKIHHMKILRAENVSTCVSYFSHAKNKWFQKFWSQAISLEFKVLGRMESRCPNNHPISFIKIVYIFLGHCLVADHTINDKKNSNFILFFFASILRSRRYFFVIYFCVSPSLTIKHQFEFSEKNMWEELYTNVFLFYSSNKQSTKQRLHRIAGFYSRRHSTFLILCVSSNRVQKK